MVPIAIHGSARIRNWKRLQFPTVTVRYGEAICWERIADPTRDQQRAVAEAILEEIRDTNYDGVLDVRSVDTDNDGKLDKDIQLVAPLNGQPLPSPPPIPQPKK